MELRISEAGSYNLQGREVPALGLTYELKALQTKPGSVVLNIAAEPSAPYVAVGVAVRAAQDAGIGNVAFITSGPAK